MTPRIASIWPFRIINDFADACNGQQGDMWDGQKDMALAMLRAVVIIVIVRITNGKSTLIDG